MQLNLVDSTINASKQLKTIRLSESEHSVLHRNLAQIKTNLHGNQELFLKQSYDIIRKYLPDSIFNEVANLKTNFDSEGCLLIQNMPIDQDLGSTPNNVIPALGKNSLISESCLVGIGQILGEIFGYKNENNGSLVHNVYPQKYQHRAISNAGSEVALPLHTEDVHVFPYSPDFLGIYCLRNEPNCKVFTYILNVKSVLSNLSPKILEILSSPVFYVEPPQSFGGASQRSKVMPLIRGNYLHPHITTEFTDMRGICSDASEALKIFKDICNKSPYLMRISLEPRDILIFDNRKVIHGRSPFSASFSEEGRWCQRIFIKCGDLWDWRNEFHTPRILKF
jgi:L-asparagine oxygenase